MNDSPTPEAPAAGMPAVPETPFCGALRSKKFFMLDVLPTEAAQYLDDSGYCWCGVTYQVVGPDGSMAGPEYCAPGRRCYRSGLES